MFFIICAFPRCLNPFLFQVSYFQGQYSQSRLFLPYRQVLIPFCFRSLISHCTCYVKKHTIPGSLNPFLFQVSYFIMARKPKSKPEPMGLNPFLFQVSYFALPWYVRGRKYSIVLIPFCFRSLISFYQYT